MATTTALVSLKGRTRPSGLVLGTGVDRGKAFRRARVHTFIVRGLRLALPAVALGLCAYYGVTLRLATGWNGLTLPTPPTFNTENLAMENPRYEGFSKDGGRFVVTAKTAKQDLRDRNAPVQLTGVDGNFVQPDQTVTNLKAKLGSFDSKQNQLELYDGIEVVSQSGMRASLTRATVLTKEHKIVSREPVMVEMQTGTVSGRQMQIDQKTRQIAFTDGVAARVKPERRATGAAAAGSPRGFGSGDDPVDITSDRLDVDDAAKLAVFKGTVRAAQGEAVLETEQLEIIYEGGDANEQRGSDPRATSKVKTIVSRVPVVMTQGTDRVTGDSLELDAAADTTRIVGRVVMASGSDRSARADRAEMNQKSDTVLLTGAVHVTQSKNELKGRRLFVDRKTGRAQLTGTESGSGGRISTRLYQADAKPAAAGKRATIAAQPAEQSAMPGFGTFKTDPTAPIDVEAASLDINDMAKNAIYRGDVRVTQGDVKMATTEMTAFYTGQMGLNMAPGQQSAAPTRDGAKPQTQLNRIEARKGVAVTSKDGQTANGDWADFDTKANTITLGGNVKLTQGQTVLRGSKLVVDLTTGQYDLTMDGIARPADASKRQAADGSVAAVAPEPQGPFTSQTTGRPRAVLYPQQFKALSNKQKVTAPAQPGAAATTGTAPTPAGEASNSTPLAEPAQRKRRSPDTNQAYPTSVFGPTSSN
jgi:LPS export ABC transporter protein LptC/lipopolysaccharide transport protein LptA